MRFEDYYCTKCSHLVEDVEAESFEKLPKTIKCPECGSRCKRKIGATIHISESFKAISKRGVDTPGAEFAKQKMKKYSGLRDPNSTSKRFY